MVSCDKTGYYKCEKCNSLIKVISCKYHARYLSPYEIDRCAHCGYSKIKVISKNEFDNCETSLWIKVSREYDGTTLLLSIKFLSKVLI